MAKSAIYDCLVIAVQMIRLSAAYFMSFALTVPLASWMIIYGLYQLRTYLLEDVEVAETSAEAATTDGSRKLYDTMLRSRKATKSLSSQLQVTVSVATA